ncbi:MAG: type I restriction endonuclease subunit R [Ignavibacteriales bacterium]
MLTAPLTLEDAISQVPALQLLQALGFTYLTPGEALRLRGGKRRNVILEDVLAEWLRSHNTIRYRGEELPFSEPNIIAAVQSLADVPYDGLIQTSQNIYDLLCLGKSFQQAVAGDVKSFSLRYIDWEHPENNVYQVTEEYEVERRGSADTYRVDIVLFVNGIPFAVIECKRPEIDGKDSLPQAIQQQIRNQKDDGIPHLYQFSQVLLAVNKNDARYATTGTPQRFWAIWREERLNKQTLGTLVNTPLSPVQKDRLYLNRPRYIRDYFEALEAAGPRAVTEQDRVIYNLCRPERLLELAYRYILFDAGEKKIARYQQYFCVKEALGRITAGRDERGGRRGGVVWHTQGSGKSLTMVMLAKGIALEPSIKGHKIVLVTDRIELDDQIRDTFKHCRRDVEQAKSSHSLAKLLQDERSTIITTIIDKFETAVGLLPEPIDSDNIFVLVDESHRGQYGQMHAKMRRALPRACYLGFTGTPVMKRDKNTVAKFGGYIHIYNIEQAVRDKTVLPLLYEGRHVTQVVYEQDIDSWFGVVAEGLSGEQAADLKRKFSTSDQLNKAEQRVKRIAYDISVHFRDNWQGTGFKAQLVAPDKATALLYHKYLQEFGMVTSAVLISPPDSREGDTDVHEEKSDEVGKFWATMMKKYGNEVQYNKQLVQAFKHGDDLEIIIVVDKLLTGFDAPRNTVLYLCRRLREHTLLQAIARVNRIHEGKEFGYILDYRGVLEDLSAALDIYAMLPEFDRQDLEAYAATLVDISSETEKLPQRYSDLWDIFKSVANRYDEEAYEVLLSDPALRNAFYERLTLYAKSLAIALSSDKFLKDTRRQRIDAYQRDLKFFEHLRSSVRLRYAESIDYRQYEPRIRKLIDQYVGAGAVEQITEPVDIFDEEAFAAEVAQVTGDAARADTIAHRALRTCIEHMDEDPAFYKKFSEMLKEAIEAFREERLKAAEYLKVATDILRQIVHRTDDDIPEPVRHRDVARAYYGCVIEVLTPLCAGKCDPVAAAADAAIAIDNIVASLRVVNWATNIDVQNQMRNRIDESLFELKKKYGFGLPLDQMNDIIEKCLNVAKVRVR